MRPEKCPKSVKVVGKTYAIEIVDTVGDGTNLGEVDNDGQRIELGSGHSSLEAFQDTLLHETMHAIEYAMDIELEEHEIHRLTAGVLQVLRDNPSFTRFVLSKPRKR